MELITVIEPKESDRSALPYFVLQEIIKRQVNAFRQDKESSVKITPSSCSAAGRARYKRNPLALQCLTVLTTLGLVKEFQSASGMKFSKYKQMYVLSDPVMEAVEEFYKGEELPEVMEFVLKKALAQQCFEKGTNIKAFKNFRTSASNYLKVEFKSTKIGIII